MFIPGDWIEVQVDMQFQIGNRHGRGCNHATFAFSVSKCVPSI